MKPSFTKYSKVCPQHIQDEENRCYCELSEGNCKKRDCPKKEKWKQ